MRYLTVDTECTCLKLHPTKLNGSPFARKNSLTYVGLRTDEGDYLDFSIDYGEFGYGQSLKKIQELIDEHDCLVGFNIKFDLHWLRRYGITFKNKRVFDCQLAEFILSNQSCPYPSLDVTAEFYGLEGKLDVVKEEYWKKGIDTDHVPEDILTDYLKQDVMTTWEVFENQQTRVTYENRVLLSLANQDLLALEEIEYNGMKYNTSLSMKLGDEIQIDLDSTDSSMRSFLDTPEFKPSSNDHVSAALYGGVIKWPSKESYIFTYKDGRTAEKIRNIVVEKTMPRLVSPIKGSDLAKEGYYATNEPTLLSLKAVGATKKFIAMLMERSGLEKRRGTYLHGLPAMMEEMDWEPDYIHGQLNQCVAITGRLSSSKPNMQNFDKKISKLFISRYPE